MRILCYLPAFIAAFWTRHMEKKGNRQGRKLSNQELLIIQNLNIKYPERVRIQYVDRILFPFHSLVRWLSQFTNIVSSDPIGITLGYSIFIKEKYRNQINLLPHELVHIQQYELYGSHISFLQEYIYQCIIYGYNNCPLEKEAETISADLMNNRIS